MKYTLCKTEMTQLLQFLCDVESVINNALCSLVGVSGSMDAQLPEREADNLLIEIAKIRNMLQGGD